MNWWIVYLIGFCGTVILSGYLLGNKLQKDDKDLTAKIIGIAIASSVWPLYLLFFILVNLVGIGKRISKGRDSKLDRLDKSVSPEKPMDPSLVIPPPPGPNKDR